MGGCGLDAFSPKNAVFIRSLRRLRGPSVHRLSLHRKSSQTSPSTDVDWPGNGPGRYITCDMGRCRLKACVGSFQEGHHLDFSFPCFTHFSLLA